MPSTCSASACSLLSLQHRAPICAARCAPSLQVYRRNQKHRSSSSNSGSLFTKRNSHISVGSAFTTAAASAAVASSTQYPTTSGRGQYSSRGSGFVASAPLYSHRQRIASSQHAMHLTLAAAGGATPGVKQVENCWNFTQATVSSPIAARTTTTHYQLRLLARVYASVERVRVSCCISIVVKMKLTHLLYQP